ncbi:hypothetical protein DWW39_11355 [Clostridium sp. AF15-31]|jgi:hypothetical protein|nr:hypothetical protein DWW39_11355 [Clostridium sp. AF15-31]
MLQKVSNIIYNIKQNQEAKFMKKYETPQMNIVEFETEDIICTSGDVITGDNETPIIPGK